MKRLIFLSLFLSLIFVAHAQYPTVTKTVNDFAGILSPAEEQALAMMIEEIKQNTLVEIAIVTVNTTKGDDRINFAARIGEQSGIGQKKGSNGIVILYSLENEKGGAIATGRGIESILNDAKAARIGRTSSQYFDSGQYAKGFGTILEGISAELKPTNITGNCYLNGQPVPCKDAGKYVLFIIAIIIVIIILIVLSSKRFGKFGPGVGGFYGGGKGRRPWRGRIWGRGGFGGGSFGGGGGKF